jgi:ubiquinol-cytochrome c reductase cytochrome b subunit
MVFARRRARVRQEMEEAAEGGYRVLDRRFPVSEGGKELLRKAFPDHWSFLLGELALYSFVVLLLTGVYLTFFFEPSAAEHPYTGSYGPMRGVLVSDAYASTLRISFDVRGGLMMRQIHHWAALLFLFSIAIHMLRIFFTGAFRRPREGNWIIGITMFLIGIAEGFCGYSLPDDLLSGTGLRIAQGVVQSIPVVGTYISFFAFGGQFPGTVFVFRLYIFHVLLLPGLLLALVTVHLIMVIYLKHTHWAGRHKTNRNAVGPPMFPHYTAKSLGLFFCIFGVIAVMSAVAQINPIWDYGPYVPNMVSTASQPDWYIGFLEGSLRLMPSWETDLWGHTIMWNVFLPAVVLPLLLFTALYLYPFLERWVTGDRAEHHLCDRPRNRPARTGLGVAGITFYAVLLFAGANDVLATTFEVPLNFLTWLFRMLLFLGPVLAFVVTRRLCLQLQEQDRKILKEGKETGRVTQSVEGTFSSSHRQLPAYERFVLQAQEPAVPVSAEEGDARSRRVRAALSQWFYRDAPRQKTADTQDALDVPQQQD